MASSTVLGVLLNLLSERDMVRSMRVSGDPVRLSAVFLHMHRTGVLQHLNVVQQVGAGHPHSPPLVIVSSLHPRAVTGEVVVLFVGRCPFTHSLFCAPPPTPAHPTLTPSPAPPPPPSPHLLLRHLSPYCPTFLASCCSCPRLGWSESACVPSSFWHPLAAPMCRTTAPHSWTKASSAKSQSMACV